MEQTERIKLMEQHLDRAATAVMNFSAALDQYEEAQDALKALSDYYGSDEWKQDFADDERQRVGAIAGIAGRLPADLKRGVLSEDALWNLLEDWREVKERLRAFTIKHQEKE